MSRSIRAALRLCTGLACVLVLDVTAQAQWAYWEIGSNPWGGLRYRGPILGFDIGGTPPPPALGPADPLAYPLPPAAVPPWHYRHDPPQPRGAAASADRFHHDLDRTHRYRTREERYADDFRDRYAVADPLYRSYRPGPAPLPARPPIDRRAPVPGVSFGLGQGHQRSFVADAEVGDLLRPAAMRLINSLSRKRDGALWMNHLQPDRIIAAIDRAEFPGSLSDLVEHYEEVLRNPRLVLIAEADGFRDTHRLLSQYVLLQSRYPGSEFPSEPYEAFAGPAEVIIDEQPKPVDLDSLNPPLVDLNSAFPEPPPAPAPPVSELPSTPELPSVPQLSPVLTPPSVLLSPAEPDAATLPVEPMPSLEPTLPAEAEIQDLPAPVGEPLPQP